MWERSEAEKINTFASGRIYLCVKASLAVIKCRKARRAGPINAVVTETLVGAKKEDIDFLYGMTGGLARSKLCGSGDIS